MMTHQVAAPLKRSLLVAALICIGSLSFCTPVAADTQGVTELSLKQVMPIIPAAAKVGARPLDKMKGVHPRILIPAGGLAELGKLLKLTTAPRIIEGIDVANISGQENCGSLVRFIDGKPFKAGYRRFKIKTVEGSDDYASIAEVLSRRYRLAGQEHELYPDVILIDGGLGQLHAALDVLDKMAKQPPMVIALAKRQEEIYVQGESKPIRLRRNSAALQLCQRIRDEAHRFAQQYHHVLRRKKTFGKTISKSKMQKSK